MRAKSIAAGLALSFMATIPAQADSWIEIKGDTRPTARSGHTLVAIGDNLYLFGGLVPTEDRRAQGPVHNVWRFDGQKWVEIVDRAPTEVEKMRFYHSGFVVGGKMYLFGGQTQDDYLNDMWAFDPDTLEWVKIDQRGTVPGKRCAQAAAVANKKVIVYGGYTYGSSDGGYSGALVDANAWSFDLLTHIWRRRSPHPGGSRSGSAATTVSDKVYVFGGVGADGKPRNDVTSYDPQTGTWHVERADSHLPSGAAPTPRAFSAIATNEANGTFYVFGGRKDLTTTYADTWEYTPATLKWVKKRSMPIALTQAAVAPLTLNGKTTYIVFGGKNKNTVSARTFQYVPD